MKLKVCGMRDMENIKSLAEIGPDLIGFIFYKKSPRFVSQLDEETLALIPDSTLKTGVFVDASLDEIMTQVARYRLDAVQLHGDESVELVKELKQRGLTVIKVFRIMDELPQGIEAFEGEVDYFLFDTKSTEYGGTGHHFDWSALSNYSFDTPYFLSGGLRLEDIEEVKTLQHPMLAGIDVNSKFEIAPGLKDLNLVRQLRKRL